MPNTTQPTFIPHDTSFTPGAGHSRKGIGDLIVLLSIVLFVASAALAVGVFLYGEYLKQSSTSKLEQLERARAAFEPSLIQELTRLDERMLAAGEVLGAHIAPSAFFRMLEQTTIASVQYTSLSFETTETQRMTIKMKGIAESVNAIALQADLFSKGGMIVSPIFSNINRAAAGVQFDLSAQLNPTAINFAQLVLLGAQGSAVPAAPSSDIFEVSLPPGGAEEEGAPLD